MNQLTLNHCTLEEVDAYLKAIDIKQPDGQDYFPVRVTRQLAVTMRENAALRYFIRQVANGEAGADLAKTIVKLWEFNE